MLQSSPLTSDWPLSGDAQRVLMPAPLLAEMGKDTLCKPLYPKALGYYPVAAGHRMARQDPDDWLVIYCVAGRAQVTLDADPVQVHAGDLLLLPAGRAHQYQADSTAPWSLYWMHLAGTDCAHWFAALGNGHGGVLSLGLHDRLLSDFRALLALTTSQYSLAASRHASSLCRSLLSFATLLLQRAPHSDSPLALESLHSFMQQHLHQRLTLEQLAAAAGQASRFQFIRQYKQLTGQTPMQAFAQMKISRACYLLEISDASVAAIAQQSGFDDAYYFSRLFKKIVGVAPSQYRSWGQTAPTP